MLRWLSIFLLFSSLIVAAPRQIKMAWDHDGTNVQQYVIYHSLTAGGPYTPIGTSTTLTYTDTREPDNKTHYYVVTAKNSAGESTYSNQLSVRLDIPVEPQVPNPPTNLRPVTFSNFTILEPAKPYPVVLGNWNLAQQNTLWIKARFSCGVGECTGGRVVVKSPSRNSSTWRLSGGLAAGDVYFSLNFDDGTGESLSVQNLTFDLINNGEHTLEGYYDGSKMQIFLDSVLVAEKARTGKLAVSQDPVTIGANLDPAQTGTDYANGYSSYFTGTIHEITIGGVRP